MTGGCQSIITFVQIRNPTNQPNNFFSFIFSRVIPDLMENPVIVEVATRLGKSPAQILLRYLLELGVAAIPKSTNANRLRSNIDLFDFSLTEDDKIAIKGLDSNIRINDFAFFKGIQKHAEWPFAKMD